MAAQDIERKMNDQTHAASYVCTGRVADFSAEGSTDLDSNGPGVPQKTDLDVTPALEANEPIAIIGMAFKFPQGSETPQSFWDMLVERRCAVSEIPKDRFDIDAFWDSDPEKQNTIKTRYANFLEDDIRNFDAGFFSMAPNEVASMDPQQRGLLETTYHALENANLTLQDVAGSKTSVHIGCFTNDFANMQSRDTQHVPKYSAIGSAGSILANRISWFYDLYGESMYIDTACSSSLVAMSLACQSLSSGASSMALVGAANIIFGPEFNIALSNMNFLSPSGMCRSFDASGDGYGRGEGFATLALKPVSQALADGNPIRAVIRATGLNQDGHTSGGITQPSKDLQVRLIRDTYERAGLDMGKTQFFEAHGTGTAVGDPIEARAIGESFLRSLTASDSHLYVGACKSNIGHLEGTSGLAGIVKAVLALERRLIPPNANFQRLNPAIDAEFFRLRFPTQCVPWPEADVRRASVNSFGFGGANAHVVLEAADTYLKGIGRRQKVLPLPWVGRDLHNGAYSAREGEHDLIDNNGTKHAARSAHIALGLAKQSRPLLLTLSAADEHGVERQFVALSRLLKSCSRCGGPDLLYGILNTLNTRRTLHEWRSFGVLSNISDFGTTTQLMSKPEHVVGTPDLQLGLIFTGQGAQWPGMAHEIIKWPVVERSLKRSMKILRMLGCDWDLFEEINAFAKSSNIHDPEYSQTITTAVQLALVDLVEHISLRPAAAIGHSSGETAAAYCSGYLCQESAIRVSYNRGRLAAKLSRTYGQADDVHNHYGMAAIGLSAAETLSKIVDLQEINKASFVANEITVSCINSPRNVTISGPAVLLDEFVSFCEDSQVFAKRLKVNVAYHSPQMNQVAAEYLRSLNDLRPGHDPGRVRMVSSVSPGLVSLEDVCHGEYWVRNMVSPVRFLDALHVCVPRDEDTDVVKRIDGSHMDDIFIHGWLELGPHPALRAPVREFLSTEKRPDHLHTSFLSRNTPANVTVLTGVGELHTRGFGVDISQVMLLDPDYTRDPYLVVDLPKYAFDHDTVYWDEPARSRLFRSRSHASHPFFGAPVLDWNSADAKWRFLIKKEELPWISEHVVNGNMLYPAAGMLVMGIEAFKQLLSDRERQPVGFELSEVSFPAPILLTDTPEGTEVHLCMSTTPGSDSYADPLRFRIFVRRQDDTWQEVCHGIISPDFGRSNQNVTTPSEEQRKISVARAEYRRVLETCRGQVETSEMYAEIAQKTGLFYGPMFQNLDNIRYDSNGSACATLLPCKAQDVLRKSSITIHPSTLDSVFQSAIPALSNGMHEICQTFVPSRLTRLWVSTTGVGHTNAEPEVLNSRARYLSRRSATCDIQLFSGLDLDPRLQVSELEFVEIARNSSTDMSAAGNVICHEMHWKPDLSLLPNPEIQKYFNMQRETTQEPVGWYQDMELMLLCFTARVLVATGQPSIKPISTMQRYHACLRRSLDSYIQSTSSTTNPESYLTNPELLESLCSKIGTTSIRGIVNTIIGKNLEGILLGLVDPLQLLYEDNTLLPRFYEELNSSGKAFALLENYLDHTVHKDPGLSFLEIGAGTGATTKSILSVIAGSHSGPRYYRYLFTDISSAFFGRTQEIFEPMSDRIDYRTLDIGEVLESQDFPVTEQYDIVIAANVLHATKSLAFTLSNVHRLLKPSGKLIVMEMTTPNSLWTNFAFGTLQGWWLGREDFRQNGAVVSEDKWHQLLLGNGFSGIDLIFRDWDSDVCHGWSIMISSVASLKANDHDTPGLSMESIHARPADHLLVFDETSEREVSIADSLVQSNAPQILFEATSIARLLSIGDLNTRCIVLLCFDAFSLERIEPEAFYTLQKVLTQSKKVLWVSVFDLTSKSAPYASMVDGLCRVLRSENSVMPIATLSLEDCSPARASMHIERVFVAMLGIEDPDSDATSQDTEYKEHGGMLCINRLSNVCHLDNRIHAYKKSSVQHRPFGAGPPLKLEIQNPGLLDTIEWVEDERAHVALDPDQIEIQIQAIGVNFKECLTLLGRVNSDHLGSECAGYVLRIGSEVNHVSVGDRVAVITLESYRSIAIAWDFQVVKIPSEMSFTSAAAIPTAFYTAYYSLVELAQLKKDETVLIHAAAGGTGQAAVQIALYVGAEVYATVGSERKKQVLMNRYGIPEDHILYSRDSSFADGIRRMTNGRGVDVILNSWSGKLLIASWEIIAPFGRFIEIGRKDIDVRGHLPMFPFINNTLFAGVDLVTIVNGQCPRMNYILPKVFELIATGSAQSPYPLNTFRLDQREEAVRLLQSGKSTGKIVLDVADDTLVPVREGPNRCRRFAVDATYVVAGGLGGLGRQITRWLVKRGAKHIIVLSRSGTDKHPSKSALIQELSSQHIKFQHAKCDITDLESLKNALHTATQGMPPIRGCFQAAMVLRDHSFGTMDHEDWITAVQPKVAGSWNLHLALPSDLDFFIMLASSSGIFGNAGQSNYAAGNTFQDALARYRLARGQKAVSIDVGMVLGAGFVAENPDVYERLMRLAFLLPLEREELFAILDHYCDPEMTFKSCDEGQIITGLRIPELIRRKGHAVPETMYRALFRGMHQIRPDGIVSHVTSGSGENFATLFAQSESPEGMGMALAEALKEKVCKMLGIEPMTKSVNDRMDSFGVDSLIALELRNWLLRNTRADLAVYEILGDVRLSDIGMTIAKKSSLSKWN